MGMDYVVCCCVCRVLSILCCLLSLVVQSLCCHAVTMCIELGVTCCIFVLVVWLGCKTCVMTYIDECKECPDCLYDSIGVCLGFQNSLFVPKI